MLSIIEYSNRTTKSNRYRQLMIWKYTNPKLAHFMYRKWTLSSMAFLGSIAYIVHETMGANVDIAMIVVNCCFAIPYLIALIMSLNPEAFGMVFKSFDFKIKVMLCFLFYDDNADSIHTIELNELCTLTV